MARGRRLFVAGQTYFILLQGHNGNNCFYDAACFRFYLGRLFNCLGHFDVRLHAYVLLPNEIQLLFTPATPTGISELMKLVGGAYVQYFNNRFTRSGSLWRGRFRSCLVPSGRGTLDCQKYMELAPLRQGCATHPGAYEWSSYCSNAFGGSPVLVMHDALRNHFGSGPGRFQAYRDYMVTPMSDAESGSIDLWLRYDQSRKDPSPVAGRARTIRTRHPRRDQDVAYSSNAGQAQNRLRSP